MRRVEASDHYGGPSVSEAELRARVVQLAHAAGWRVFSLPIAKTRRPVKDAVGYPDLTLARHGDVLWLELKADSGIVSDVQRAWAEAVGLDRHRVIRPSDLEDGTLARVLASGPRYHAYMGKIGRHSQTGEDQPF